MQAWRLISNRRIRTGWPQHSISWATESSGRYLAISGTCTWSKIDRVACRDFRGPAQTLHHPLSMRSRSGGKN